MLTYNKRIGIIIITTVFRYHPDFYLLHSRHGWNYILGDQAATERGVSEIHDGKTTGENLYARKKKWRDRFSESVPSISRA